MGLGADLANIFDAGCRGAEIMEFGFRIICNHRRQRSLSDTGRAIKNKAAEPVGLKHFCKKLIGPKKVLLSDKLT